MGKPKKLQWSTEPRRVGDLKLLDFNPRKISEEQKQKLRESLEKFGLVEIPALDFDNVVISGNQRTGILKLTEGDDHVIDVRVPNRKLTELELKEYNLTANTHAGEFDIDSLLENFSELNLDDFGIDIPEPEDVLELDVEEDEYNMPAVGGVKTDIVEGDLIEIGPHRLLCGDSTQTDTFKKLLLPDELVDLVVTDPPYNVNYEGGTGLKIKNDNMEDSKFYQFLYDFYSALNSFVKPGGVWYVWHADSEGANFRQAMKDAGITVRQCLIWVKNSLVLGRQDYHWKHEPCLEASTPTEEELIKTHEPCLYGWKDGAGHLWRNDRTQTTILEYEKPSKNAEHPTMKPVPLISYQVKNNSRPGQVVADAFGGSGTTMVAAHELGRVARLVEFDPKYCQVIVDRMMKLDSSLKIKRNGKAWKPKKKNAAAEG